MYVHVCALTHVEIREQLTQFVFSFHCVPFFGLNSGQQTCWQVLTLSQKTYITLINVVINLKLFWLDTDTMDNI